MNNSSKSRADASAWLNTRRNPEARALAIPWTNHEDSRWVSILDALILILVAALFFSLVSCQVVDNGVPVDYGPEVSADIVNDAKAQPSYLADPLLIKKGQFIRTSYTQELAMSNKIAVVSDTGLTVIDRIDTETDVTIAVVEKTIIYGENGKYSETNPIQTTKVFSKTQAASAQSTESAQTQSVSEEMIRALAQERVSLFENNVKSALVDGNGNKVTYHRLKTWTEEVAPPAAVQSQANCGGIPNCKILMHKISYDRVTWSTPEGDRVRYEYDWSTDVPYYATIMKVCMTRLVPIPNSDSKVLLKECVPVENFKFE